MKRAIYLLGWALALGGCQKQAEEQKAPKPAPANPSQKPLEPVKTTHETIRKSFRVMGTQMGFTAYGVPKAQAEGAFEAAFYEFKRLEALMSTWKPQSDVSLVNLHGAKNPVRVGKDTLLTVKKALELSKLTQGRFDIGFGALAGLWRFDHDQDNQLPDPKKVKARLPLVNYRNIQLDEAASTIFLKKKGMRLHLGGIGKGYAVDRAVEILRGRGLKDFMVQAGGDMYVAGKKGDRPWRVAIRDPRGPVGSFFAATEVTDATFSTSGDYERFFIKDGVRYHHIIDPTTGKPATACRSVTILAPDAMTADALSTGLFILGVRQGLPLVETLAGVEAVMVDSANKVHVSSGFEGKLKIFHAPSDGI